MSIRLLLALALAGAIAPAFGQTAPAAGSAGHEPDKVRSALMAIVPPRVAIDRVAAEGELFIVGGTSGDQTQVSEFLRAIFRAGDFAGPELRNISRIGDRYGYEISLKVACAHGPAKSGPRLCNPPPSRPGTVHRCRVNGTLTFQATPCAPGQEG